MLPCRSCARVRSQSRRTSSGHVFNRRRSGRRRSTGAADALAFNLALRPAFMAAFRCAERSFCRGCIALSGGPKEIFEFAGQQKGPQGCRLKRRFATTVNTVGRARSEKRKRGGSAAPRGCHHTKKRGARRRPRTPGSGQLMARKQTPAHSLARIQRRFACFKSYRERLKFRSLFFNSSDDCGQQSALSTPREDRPKA